MLLAAAHRAQIRAIYRAIGKPCVCCHRELTHHNDRQLDKCAVAMQWPAKEVYAVLAPPALIAEPMPTKRAPAQKRRAA